MFSTPMDRAYIIPENMQAREKFLQLRRPRNSCCFRVCDISDGFVKSLPALSPTIAEPPKLSETKANTWKMVLHKFSQKMQFLKAASYSNSVVRKPANSVSLGVLNRGSISS